MSKHERIGVLMVNLGTPDSPKTGDVRKYLNEFLTDGRVIDIPWAARQLLVRGIISPTRAPQSAKSYREIWEDKGSPLKFLGEELIESVQKALDGIGQSPSADSTKEYVVELAMRYQSPSIEDSLLRLRDKKVSRIIVFPLFPQYSSASTGSAHQKVMEVVGNWLAIPPINFIGHFYDHPGYIKSFIELGKAHNPSDYDYVLFSFHGLPERHLRNTNLKVHCLQDKNCCQQIDERNQFCYSAQCYRSAKLIAEGLGIPEDKYKVTFQSRLGKDPWVKPYTDLVLEELAGKGVKRVLAFSPAFVADCLETIFEIGVEYQEDFESWGGEKVQLVESLNTHPTWIQTVVDIISKH